ncbi:MAG TPA: YdeI/OmpD-associated family protein [Anaerolineales bacterium]|nr:YdeI/OmpD-associated family protein [Anaerolineales bacterium]
MPVRGTINGKKFKQTLVKYQSAWRLYINGEMRQAAGVDVGDQAYIKIEFDLVPRIEAIHPKFVQALLKNKAAKAAFEKLKPSRQKEMLRYLNSMKTETSLERNIEKIIHHLLEGRD